MHSIRLAILALMFAACSGSSSSTDAGATATQACTDEATALCALRESCSPFSISRTWVSQAICTARTSANCEQGLAAPDTAETASRAEACASAYPSETCRELADNDPVATCTPPTGRRGSGSPCGTAGQCASTYCAVTSTTICGMCQPLPAVGDSCTVAADCGRDLACALETGSTSGQCATFAGSGAACLTGTQPCDAGLACVGDNQTNMTNGTCMPSGMTVGAACDSSRATMANCDGNLGLTCIPAAKGSSIGTCMNIQLVGAGSACGDIGAAPITGFADCTAGGLCVKATGATTGTCVAPAADGAACDSDPTIGPPCTNPAKCVPTTTDGGTAGTCMVPDAASCD